MDQMNRSHNQKWEEIFAEAAERVQAGEPVDAVLSSYPQEYQQRLRDLLAIVDKASELHHAPIPTSTVNRRAANRQALLQAAAQKRAQLEPLVTSVRRQPVVQKPPTWSERLNALGAGFQALFVPRTLRLAMTLAALIVLVLGSTTLVSAQSAIPGDFTYPVKQWIRTQQLALTPPEQFNQVSKAQEIEVKSDVQKAQQQADLNKTAISARAMLVFYKDAGTYMLIGSLHVLPSYQPDPNQTATKPMAITGKPEPESIVLLEYQIIPGSAVTADGPVVQGISLQVLKLQAPEPTVIPTFTPAPPLTDTPTPLPTDTATSAPLPDTPVPACTVEVQPGALPYNSVAGDTLVTIAEQFGVSVATLRAMNCLTTDEVTPGSLILLPSSEQGNPSTTTPEPTATAVSTDTVPATATTIAPTVVTTATLVPGPVTTDGLTATLTALPTAVVVPATPASTPEPTDTGSPTAVVTPEATTSGTDVATPEITAAPTDGTATPVTATPSETAVATEIATTPEASPTATPMPTEAAPTATEGSMSGASVTAEPPTVEPPTAEPPTALPEPPTATPEPPTALPPPTAEPPPADTPAA